MNENKVPFLVGFVVIKGVWFLIKKNGAIPFLKTDWELVIFQDREGASRTNLSLRVPYCASFFIKLLLFSFALGCAVKTRQLSKLEDSQSPKVTSSKDSKHKVPEISWDRGHSKDEILMLICSQKNQSCWLRLTDKGNSTVYGLHSDDSVAAIYTCLPDEKYCINPKHTINLNQDVYRTDQIRDLSNGIRIVEDRQVKASLLIRKYLLDLFSEFSDCIGKNEVKPENLGTDLKNRYRALLEFSKVPPLSQIYSIKKSLSGEYATELIGEMEDKNVANLALVGNDPNIRITLINYMIPSPEPMSIFKGGLQDYVYKALGAYGHTSLLIERVDPESGKTTVIRNISWPDGNDAQEDIVKYGDRQIIETRLPDITEDEYFRFESWFRDSIYAKVPEQMADELASKRLAKKIEIGDLLKKYKFPSPSSSMRELTSKHREILDRALSSGTQTKWYQEWPVYKKFLEKNPTHEDIVSFESKMHEYLQLERQTLELSALSTAEEMELRSTKSQAFDNVRSLLGMKAVPVERLEKYSFNWSDPWKIDLESMVKKIHGVDPLNKQQWSKFIDEHYHILQQNMKDSLGPKYRDSQLTQLSEYEAAEFKRVLGDWKIFREQVLDKHKITIEKAEYQLHRRTQKYGFGYSERGRNCSCAAGKALEIMYDKPGYFTKSGFVPTTPGSVRSKAQEFSAQKSIDSGRYTAGMTAASVVTGAAAVAVAAALFVNRDKIFKSKSGSDEPSLLLSGNSIDICLQSAQQDFFNATEQAFNGLRSGYFWQRMVSYFLNPS